MPETAVGLPLSEPEIALVRKLAVAENLSLAAVAAIALLNLVGRLPLAASGLFKDGWRPMGIEAAAAAFLCAASIYFLRSAFADSIRMVGGIAAILVAAGSAASFAARLFPAVLATVPGHAAWIAGAMTLPAAEGFALVAIAIVFAPARGRTSGLIADFFAFWALFVVAVLVSGHLIGVLSFFGTVSTFATSSQTLLCLTLLAAVIFLQRAECGIFSILLGRGIGSKVARVIAPVLLIMPYLREGLRAHIFEIRRMPSHYVTAFLATVAVAISMALLMYLAWRLNVLEIEIQDLSLRDPLTGLYNLRGFRLLAEQALLLAHRSGQPFSVLFVDMDNLKQINDALGHQTGSELLAAIGDLLRQEFRETDVLGRVGGDEFAVAGQFSRSAIAEAAQRLREAAAQWGAPGATSPLDFSVGWVTSGPEKRDPLASLLARADQEMYYEKRRRKAAMAARAKHPKDLQPSLLPVPETGEPGLLRELKK